MRIGVGRAQGQMLAAMGGAGLIGGLWLPWYTARLPRSAWQTFTAAPAVLAVTAAVVIVLSLLELGQWVGDTSPLIILAGAVGTILVAYRLAVPPSGDSAWGAYLSFAAALAMILGGVLAAAGDWIPELPMPTLDVGPAPAAQPAPPSPV